MSDYRTQWEIDAEAWARETKTSDLVEIIIDWEFDRRDPNLIRTERMEARWAAAAAEIDRRIPVPK